VIARRRRLGKRYSSAADRVARLAGSLCMTLLSACSTTASVGTGWLRPPDPPEILYQGVSGADFATTVSIARQSRCYREVGFPTAQIIGSHPSVGAVEGWWAVQATSHYMISQWLDREI
jgi:hypothetical protein